MFQLFFALFMAFACPAHNNTNNGNGTAATQNIPTPNSGGGTGGEGGHVHPGN